MPLRLHADTTALLEEAGFDQVHTEEGPARFRPSPRFARPGRLRGLANACALTSEPSHFSPPKPMELVLRPDEHWYRLRRE